MLTRTVQVSTCFAAAALLAACGGSSSGIAPQYPVDSAISAYFQEPHQYTLHASNGGDTYTLDLNYTPEGQQSFGTYYQSTMALSVLRAMSISKNGTQLTQSLQMEYFTADPYVQVGAVQDTLNYVTLYSNQKHMSELAAIGDSGQLDSGKVYANNNWFSPIDSIKDSWYLQGQTGSDAELCIRMDYFSFLSGDDIDTYCYTIDTGGDVLGLTVSLPVNGTTLMFK